MRSNIVMGVVACGLAVSLGALVMAPKGRESAAQVPQPAAAPASPDGNAPEATPERPSPAAPAASPAPGQPDGSTAEQMQEAYVAARSAELMELAMNDDDDSLNAILSELGNRDPRIRGTAVQATVQFHSRDAIPRLQDAALQAEDARERVAIEDAIEFLKLPTLTEVLQQQRRPPVAGGANPAGRR